VAASKGHLSVSGGASVLLKATLTDCLLHSALTDCSVEQSMLIPPTHTRMHARRAYLSPARTSPHRGGAGGSRSHSKCCPLPTIKSPTIESSHQSVWHVTKWVAKALAIKRGPRGTNTCALGTNTCAHARHTLPLSLLNTHTHIHAHAHTQREVPGAEAVASKHHEEGRLFVLGLARNPLVPLVHVLPPFLCVTRCTGLKFGVGDRV
jgi:hypothetical protein